MMIAGTLPDTHSILVEQFEQRKFTRRDDLTADIRMQIATDALRAMTNGDRGTITNLAKENDVSRTFVYSLCSTLKDAGQFLFGESAEQTSSSSLREKAIEAILSFRLEGRSSLGSISSILGRFGSVVSSVGFISQTLSQIGALLPKTISTINNARQYIVFASDEMFSKSTPILITVDPYSSAIVRMELSDSRTAEDWRTHFKEIQANGFHAESMVSDDGQGLRAAHSAELGDTHRQSDTFHAVSHRLGIEVHTLESAAYKAINQEEKCARLFDSAKSDSVLEKRFEACQQAIDAAKEAITLYDNFHQLYLNLIGQLKLFDAQGELRTRQQTEEMTILILSLIKELDQPKLTTIATQIERALPDLFHYFDVAKTVVDECLKLPVDDVCIKKIFLAWQYGKSVMNAKNTHRKNQAKKKQQDHLDKAKSLSSLSSEAFLDLQTEIFSKLDKIVQSSAIVECINSIVRPYLNNSKNQVTQEQLNLIMFYHNHRRYREGKRKCKTPMELLTGEEQTDDWISLIFDILREENPEFLLTA